MHKICVIMGGVMPVPAVCGGAIETLVTGIAKEYSDKDGFQLTICSVYHPEAVKAAKQYPGVTFFWTHTRKPKYLFLHAIFLGVRLLTGKCLRPLQRHYNEIAKLFEKERFDLIVAEGGDTQAIVDIAKGYRREQFVNHIHIHYLPSENIVKNYGHMIGVSGFVTKEYLKACTIPVKAHVLKNAIDTDKFSGKLTQTERKRQREKLGLCEQDFVILYVGRIMQIKGVLELMEAVIGLQDEHIKLVIAGGANSGKRAFSSYERRVRRLAKQNHGRILFTGYVDNTEIYKYAAAADVQCVPTTGEEAAGLVILEAMAEGLPLIVTDSGGVREYIDESTALIVQRDNITENLKNAICFMKAHPEQCLQTAKRAKIQSEQYSQSRYYKNFVEMLYAIQQENAEDGNET